MGVHPSKCPLKTDFTVTYVAFTCTVKPVFKVQSDERTPSGQSTFLGTVYHLPHVKKSAMKGHLSCRDTFSRILRCPLKTVVTVCMWTHSSYST